MNYYKVKLLSNSMLSIVHNIVNGIEGMKASQGTLDFGSQLHEAILEPEKYDENKYTDKYKGNFLTIRNMANAARKNSILTYLLMQPGCKKERDVYPVLHERTGVNVKMRLDISLSSTIADIKTTAAKTMEDFETSIMAYSYHRQAAFYLDFTGAETFYFIGICKKFPHPTFTKKYTLDDPLIIQGREQYENLIDHYVRLVAEGVDIYNYKPVS